MPKCFLQSKIPDNKLLQYHIGSIAILLMGDNKGL